MKLLVIASTSAISTSNYFIAAFKRSGHEVMVCSDNLGPAVDVHASGVINVQALLQKRRFAADAVIFIEGGSMRMLPDTTCAKSYLTAWYAIDTHMDFDKHVRIGRLFDLTFVAQKQYVAALIAAGVPAAQWLPLAFATELATETGHLRSIDIAYVGSENTGMHPQRSALLNALRATFASTRFGRATPVEMGSIYSNSKLVFNRSVNNDVNMRFFEAMGAGAVLLTDRIVENGVEDLFVDGLHYLTYRSEEDLVRLARELLADPARLRDIGDAARDCVLARHTYQHRADEMVLALQAATKRSCPKTSDLFAACLSLGLTADALRAAARAFSQIGGGRFQRILGVSVGRLLKILAAPAAWVDRLRLAASKSRHD